MQVDAAAGYYWIMPTLGIPTDQYISAAKLMSATCAAKFMPVCSTEDITNDRFTLHPRPRCQQC